MAALLLIDMATNHQHSVTVTGRHGSSYLIHFVTRVVLYSSRLTRETACVLSPWHQPDLATRSRITARNPLDMWRAIMGQDHSQSLGPLFWQASRVDKPSRCVLILFIWSLVRLLLTSVVSALYSNEHGCKYVQSFAYPGSAMKGMRCAKPSLNQAFWPRRVKILASPLRHHRYAYTQVATLCN